MAGNFPYVYPYSHGEAVRLKEEERHDVSFWENVDCARAIEKAIRDNSTDEHLNADCAKSVLEAYGFKRVNFVLANSLKEMGCKWLISDETHQWGARTSVPKDGKYNRYYTVDTAAAYLEEFIQQARQAYQALALFGSEHRAPDELDYAGKVLILSPDSLKENCWTPQNQLWYATGGFGCSPTASGRAVYAVCLGDGEEVRWNRSDFTGVLDEQYLPDWARDKLLELRGSQQAPAEGPGMTMT